MDTELGFAHALESGAGLLHGRVEVFNVLQTHPPSFRHHEEADDQVEECTAAVRKEHAPHSDSGHEEGNGLDGEEEHYVVHEAQQT